MDIELHQLDQSDIAVDMEIAGRRILLQGRGRYERRATGSNRLHIEVVDPSGPLTIVVDEDSWNGTISQQSDGTFRIRLQSA